MTTQTYGYVQTQKPAFNLERLIAVLFAVDSAKRSTRTPAATSPTLPTPGVCNSGLKQPLKPLAASCFQKRRIKKLPVTRQLFLVGRFVRWRFSPLRQPASRWTYCCFADPSRFGDALVHLCTAHRLQHEPRHQRGDARSSRLRTMNTACQLPVAAASTLDSGTSSDAVPFAVYSRPALVAAYLEPKVSAQVDGNRL